MKKVFWGAALSAVGVLAGCSKTPDLVGVWIQEPNANTKGAIHTITFFSDGVYEDRLQAEKVSKSGTASAIVNRGTYRFVNGKLFTTPESVDLVSFTPEQKNLVEKDKEAKKKMLEPDSGTVTMRGPDEFEFLPDKAKNGKPTAIIFKRKK